MTKLFISSSAPISTARAFWPLGPVAPCKSGTRQRCLHLEVLQEAQEAMVVLAVETAVMDEQVAAAVA